MPSTMHNKTMENFMVDLQSHLIPEMLFSFYGVKSCCEMLDIGVKRERIADLISQRIQGR